jgi:hypothetical protein
MKVTVTLDIDFRMFREQKRSLLNVLDVRAQNSFDKYDCLDGLVTLIDDIQDQAIEELSKEIVFGTGNDNTNPERDAWQV